MGLQLFSPRTWKEDSFNETNVASILRDAARHVKNNPFKNNLSIPKNTIKDKHEESIIKDW